jgi:plasmid maintenance system antidote protein VapI
MGVRHNSRSGGNGAGDGVAGGGDCPAGLARAVTDALTWYMRESKVTRADLAQIMGVSPGRVSQILSGDENLTLRTVASVADALGADVEITLRARSKRNSRSPRRQDHTTTGS